MAAPAKGLGWAWVPGRGRVGGAGRGILRAARYKGCVTHAHFGPGGKGKEKETGGDLTKSARARI